MNLRNEEVNQGFSGNIPFQSKGVLDVNAPTVKMLRHHAEMPMIYIGLVLTVLAATGALIGLASGGVLDEAAGGVLVGLVTPVLLIVMIRFFYWKTISNGVQVTEKQFPELYKIYYDLAIEMGFEPNGEGLKKIPVLFLVNGNGALNAFASKCQLYRGYVVIHSDLVDVAYTHGNFAAMRFVLAHELGHIKCGHVSLWRSIINPVMTLLQLGPSVTRAQEYTADRVALYYAPDCADSLVVLFAGKNLCHRVDMDEYYRSISDQQDSIWLRIANFLADHAVGFRRMQAIADSKTQGWDVHGKML